MAFSFSDGVPGRCSFSSWRGQRETPMPATIAFRKSAATVRYDCTAADGRRVFGEILGTLGTRYEIPMPPPLEPDSADIADTQI